ncbi:MAG: hypothetical protein HGB08_03635 [Candidatus Moranbacteria bacterium]|nr:hypothetical protein [Candidatus Moranbacteria bacterium]
MGNKKGGLLKAIASVFVAQKKRLSIIGVGLSVNWITDHLFDFVLYPYVVLEYGMVKGGIIMSLASFLICWLIMLFYDWSKRDWLGIETLKEAREYRGTSKLRLWIAKTVRNNRLFLILVLSINFDPFITTAYMRRGANRYDGMKSGDWMIFLSSWFIANLYWTVATYYGATAIMSYGRIIVEICGIAAGIFLSLVMATVIFKRRLNFITKRLERRFLFLSGETRKKLFFRFAAESFVWALAIYCVLRIAKMV